MKFEKRMLTAWLIISCLLFFVPAAAWPGDPAMDQIGGQTGRDPLLVQVLDNGNMGVFDWDETYPGSGTEAYVNRYYDDYCWSTVLFFTIDGQKQVLYGDAFQDCLFDADSSIPLLSGSQVVSADQTTITTTWQHPDLAGMSLTQQVEYQPGSSVVTKTFTVMSASDDVLSDLLLLHGGDIWFFDEATFTWELPDLTVRNLDFFNSRRIVFRADDNTPWDHWYGGSLLSAWGQVAAGSLSDTVEGMVNDAACIVGWQRPDLPADESWSVTTREDYSREPTAAPTPTVTVSPTPGLTPTVTVSPTPGLTPTVTTGPTPELSPTVTASPTPEPTVTVTSGPTGGPTGSADPVTTGAIAPTAIPDELPARTGESRSDLMLILLTLVLAVSLIWLRRRLSARANQDGNAFRR
jgi:hypothetical protein